MRKILYMLVFVSVLISCQSEIPAGNVIVFVDVIGSYDGECADYVTSATDLMNREEATLTVFASSTTTAGIKTSCDRIMDQDLSVKSATAASIVFEQVMNGTKVTMTYMAEHDSITIIKTQDGKDENLIFTGKRN
jgi:hypothetical protein